jgi:hypothetical protein
MFKTFVAALALAAAVSAASPQFGTWKLNIAKSKLRNPEAIANVTMTIEPMQGQTERFTFTRTAKDGQTTKTEDVRTCDGKARPSNTPAGTMIRCEQTGDARRTIWTREGKIVQEISGTISADGKLMTNKVKGVDANGKSFDEVRVWEKQ